MELDNNVQPGETCLFWGKLKFVPVHIYRELLQNTKIEVKLKLYLEECIILRYTFMGSNNAAFIIRSSYDRYFYLKDL